MAPTVPVVTVFAPPVELAHTALVFPIAQSPIVTGNAFQVAPIPGLVVDVPDVDRPVYLVCKVILVPVPPPTAGTTAVTQLSIGVAGPSLINLDAVLDSSHAPGNENGDTPICWARLDPHSPGSYQGYATRVGAGSAVRILTPSHARARIVALQV